MRGLCVKGSQRPPATTGRRPENVGEAPSLEPPEGARPYRTPDLGPLASDCETVFLWLPTALGYGSPRTQMQ